MINRSVITIAVGKPYYLQLAENLLKSFLLWNGENDINFSLITDNKSHFGRYNTTPKVTVKQIDLDDADKSFTSKFLLYKYADAEENIFIDCDCLIYRSLEPAFLVFAKKSFSAIGNNITVGDFFCDVEKTCTLFKINAMPKFVGAVYYFKKNGIAKNIFDKAAELKSKYDELGFVRLRDKENEEPLFAVAMALSGETLLQNDGIIKADFMYYKNIKSNILAGKATAALPLVQTTGGEKIPEKVNPAILHFNGTYTESVQYKADVLRLNRQHNNKSLLQVLIWVKFMMPARLKACIKFLFRPVYRLLFGYRQIGKLQRSL